MKAVSTSPTTRRTRWLQLRFVAEYAGKLDRDERLLKDVLAVTGQLRDMLDKAGPPK